MKEFWQKIGTYFVEPKAPGVVSSRRVNALIFFIASVVFFAVGNDIAGGAFLAASVGDTALTLGGR